MAGEWGKDFWLRNKGSHLGIMQVEEASWINVTSRRQKKRTNNKEIGENLELKIN